MMTSQTEDFFGGVFITLILLLVIGGGCVTHFDNEEKQKANKHCQQHGYSAGHYEKHAGLVCEQWIEAAKLPK